MGEFDTEDGTFISLKHITVQGGGMTIEEMYNYVYEHGYDGSWVKLRDILFFTYRQAWTAGDYTYFNGVAQLNEKPEVLAVIVPNGEDVEDTCDCSDVPPSSDYTCAEQASWGKCTERYRFSSL